MLRRSPDGVSATGSPAGKTLARRDADPAGLEVHVHDGELEGVAAQQHLDRPLRDPRHRREVHHHHALGRQVQPARLEVHHGQVDVRHGSGDPMRIDGWAKRDSERLRIGRVQHGRPGAAVQPRLRHMAVQDDRKDDLPRLHELECDLLRLRLRPPL
jgi:hypothetical protein